MSARNGGDAARRSAARRGPRPSAATRRLRGCSSRRRAARRRPAPAPGATVRRPRPRRGSRQAARTLVGGNACSPRSRRSSTAAPELRQRRDAARPRAATTARRVGVDRDDDPRRHRVAELDGAGANDAVTVRRDGSARRPREPRGRSRAPATTRRHDDRARSHRTPIPRRRSSAHSMKARSISCGSVVESAHRLRARTTRARREAARRAPRSRRAGPRPRAARGARARRRPSPDRRSVATAPPTSGSSDPRPDPGSPPGRCPSHGRLPPATTSPAAATGSRRRRRRSCRRADRRGGARGRRVSARACPPARTRCPRGASRAARVRVAAGGRRPVRGAACEVEHREVGARGDGTRDDRGDGLAHAPSASTATAAAARRGSSTAAGRARARRAARRRRAARARRTRRGRVAAERRAVAPQSIVETGSPGRYGPRADHLAAGPAAVRAEVAERQTGQRVPRNERERLATASGHGRQLSQSGAGGGAIARQRSFTCASAVVARERAGLGGVRRGEQQAVAEHREEQLLDVLRQDVVAALEQRPGPRRSLERQAAADRRADLDARRPSESRARGRPSSG